jgi:hypothetical protein
MDGMGETYKAMLEDIGGVEVGYVMSHDYSCVAATSASIEISAVLTQWAI